MGRVKPALPIYERENKDMMPKDVEVGKEVMYEGQEWLVTKRVDNPGYAVIQRNGEEKRIPYGKLKPKKAPKTWSGLKSLVKTPGMEDFIEYLRTPEANTTLYFKVPTTREEAVREQYSRFTGQELVEGQGFHVYEEGANKQGAEGSVHFVPPAEYPKEVVELLSPDGTGHINHLGFVWLMVQEEFRVNRSLTLTADL